jgi:L-ribulose-5-phosphate 3-epimerase
VIPRRTFLRAAAATAAGTVLVQGRRGSKLNIGVTDWNLDETGKVEAVSLAKSLGFQGVQVSLGMKPVDGKLPTDNPELIGRYLSESKSNGIALSSTCLDILHVNYLKNDKLGPKWVSDGIRITNALKTTVILLPFFGKGALNTPD